MSKHTRAAEAICMILSGTEDSVVLPARTHEETLRERGHCNVACELKPMPRQNPSFPFLPLLDTFWPIWQPLQLPRRANLHLCQFRLGCEPLFLASVDHFRTVWPRRQCGKQGNQNPGPWLRLHTSATLGQLVQFGSSITKPLNCSNTTKLLN